MNAREMLFVYEKAEIVLQHHFYLPRHDAENRLLLKWLTYKGS